jgi:hypothetical protein
MINGSGLCSSFKLELLEGIHHFDTDLFYLALYSAGAPLSLDTTTGYITDGEIAGPGYVAGGQLLLNPQILGPVARTVYATFDDPIWLDSTLQARGALIYNQSQGNRAVAVLDFLQEQFSNSGIFRVQFPPPGPSTALIRLL